MRQIVEVSTSDFSSRRLSRFLKTIIDGGWLRLRAGVIGRISPWSGEGNEEGERTYFDLKEELV
jgi:hypothetical protein